MPKTAISLARPAKKSLGSHIQMARAEKGMSQRQLALVTGTSRSYLWRIESGTADVGIDVPCRIARALDVEVADLSSISSRHARRHAPHHTAPTSGIPQLSTE